MPNGIVATVTLASVLVLGGCTGTAQPDAAPSADIPSVQPTESSTAAGRQSDPGALLRAAKVAIRRADAVTVSSRGLVAESTVTTDSKWHAIWSADPATWFARSTVRRSADMNAVHATWRYFDGVLYQRQTLFDAPPWIRSPSRLLDISPDEVAEYPVAVVLRATAVDATLLSQGAVIQAEVPNHVADQWFGLTRMLDVNAVPDATNGGTTQIAITLNNADFPFKVSYSGDDLELSGEVSDYMQQNIAASQLTAYYKPTDLPHQLEVKPGG